MRAYRLHLGEEALVYRLAYNGDVVGFKMGRRQGKRVGGSAYWRLRRRVFATCGSDRVGSRRLRTVTLPHHRTCRFQHPAVEPSG